MLGARKKLVVQAVGRAVLSGIGRRAPPETLRVSRTAASLLKAGVDQGDLRLEAGGS